MLKDLLELCEERPSLLRVEVIQRLSNPLGGEWEERRQFAGWKWNAPGFVDT